MGIEHIEQHDSGLVAVKVIVDGQEVVIARDDLASLDTAEKLRTEIVVQAGQSVDSIALTKKTDGNYNVSLSSE